MSSKRQKFKSRTAKFGSPSRINHDSSIFYARKLYSELPTERKTQYIENPINDKYIDTILLKTSEQMDELSDNSIHLMVTSPPYNVGKEYDDELSLTEYLEFLRRIWKEVYRVLVPGGRACINIANLGRKPYIPLHSFIIKDMLEIGFLMRGEIIWNKASSASPSTAWGSWCLLTNPTLRDVHEYILVFSKDTFSRKKLQNKIPTISKEEFLEFTKSVWTFPAEPARKIGHPAPFPIELPYRLIQLYTYKNEIILDPFMGSGQTAIAAIKSQKHYIGYEIEPKYVELANKRIKRYKSELPKLFSELDNLANIKKTSISNF